MTKIAFIDTETTGLHPDRHEVWEVGMYLLDSESPREFSVHHWLLPVMRLQDADPYALEIGGFNQRHPQGLDFNGLDTRKNLDVFARAFGQLTYGARLCGAVVSFDEERLRRLLLRQGVQPGWHYHLIDIEAMMAGFLAAEGDFATAAPPWKSDALSLALDVPPPSDEERHTALGDANWAFRVYGRIMGWPT